MVSIFAWTPLPKYANWEQPIFGVEIESAFLIPRAFVLAAEKSNFLDPSPLVIRTHSE